MQKIQENFKHFESPLPSHEEELLESCKNFSDNHSPESWVQLPKNSPFVNKFGSTKDGRIMHGRAELEVDCSVEAAVIYWFDYCSIARCRTSEEKGNLARIAVETSDRSSLVATVKSAPWPFYWREFVFKTVWKKLEGEDSFVLGTKTVDDKIDYGKNFRGVKGKTIVYVTFEKISGTSCKVRITQLSDLSGFVPAFVMNMKLQLSLNVAEEMRELFQKDDEVDRLGRAGILKRMRVNKEDYTEEEQKLIADALELSERAKDAQFRSLECKDPRVFIKSFPNLGGGERGREGEGEGVVIFGQAETVIDALPDVAASWEFLLEGRNIKKNHFREGGIDRNTLNTSTHTIIYQQVRKIAPGIQPREWRSKGIWKKINDKKYLITYKDTDDFDERLGFKHNVVRASARSVLTFERLEDNMGVSQTKFIFIGRVALNGIVPHQVVELKQPEFLTSIGSTVRRTFDKSARIDRLRRDAFRKKLEAHDHNSYTKEEQGLIDGMLLKLEAYELEGEREREARERSNREPEWQYLVSSQYLT